MNECLSVDGINYISIIRFGCKGGSKSVICQRQRCSSVQLIHQWSRDTLLCVHPSGMVVASVRLSPSSGSVLLKGAPVELTDVGLRVLLVGSSG